MPDMVITYLNGLCSKEQRPRHREPLFAFGNELNYVIEEYVKEEWIETVEEVEGSAWTETPTDYANMPGEHLDLETSTHDEMMENTVLSMKDILIADEFKELQKPGGDN
jgi:hypothetical protein